MKGCVITVVRYKRITQDKGKKIEVRGMENKNIKQKGIRTLIPCQNQSFEVYVSTHTQTHSLCGDLEQLSHNFTRQQDS